MTDIIEARKNFWTETYSGKRFYTFNPQVEGVCIEDIAHALSLQCRFGGHCRMFYSVAQHSVLVSKMAETFQGINTDIFSVCAMWGLLHDAAEAYFIDVPRPVKQGIAEYTEIESAIQKVVMEAFDLPISAPECIKTFDEVALATEARDLMSTCGAGWMLPYPPLNENIRFETPEQAEKMFIKRFEYLQGFRKKKEV